ncbi:membrane dipeptidase [Flagellimonas olearia]|uniref:Membrane dipeptidase n=1 Tax=Flagellimonas olearia TaxID=552546 RepID=A0A444VI95_9FLAO|nr:membrane dipeptidase [Allomuricauda olearia]KAB7530430.1 membrane dipeptidase [Allomuricauda olearia]RYC50454.1 membrane dipeptidase [Allomuricauda olearia]
MQRRELVKSLSMLPLAGSVFPITSLLSTPAVGSKIPLDFDQQTMPELHRNAFVMDGHTHVMTRELLMGTDIGQRYSDGTVDLPRAKEGGLDAMFFSVYTPEHYYPGRLETKNTFRVINLALEQIEKNNDVIELALNASDIERINKKGKMAAFLDLEGGYDLDGDILLLQALHRLGLRSMQLTAHNTTNAFIDTCNDVSRWGGINDLGKEVIAEMNRLGMVINVAHASNDAILQTVEASKHPVTYSHGGFYSIVNHPRCITDEAAKAVAAKGGVIGIHFGSLFNNPKYFGWQQKAANETTPSSVQDFAKTLEEADRAVAKEVPLNFKGTIPDEYWMHVDQLAKVIDYGVNLVGEDHMAIGSDLDGGPELPREIKDISDFPQITMAMQRLGYSDERIKKILGLNWLRVIREVTGG